MRSQGFPRPTRLQRQTYRQGQMLQSRDFNDGFVDAAHLRWWHNRAIHDAFGIVAGLEVTLNGVGTEATVAPGLAYDGFGRELLLRTPARVSVPDEPADLTLVARYSVDTSSPCEPTAPCWPSSPGRAFAPVIAWRASRSVRLGEELPLLRLPAEVASGPVEAPAGLEALGASYDAGRKEISWRGVMSAVERNALLTLSQDASYAAVIERLFATSRGAGTSRRIPARPMARPRVGSGSFVADGVWQPWLISDGTVDDWPIGVEAAVETESVGFTATPCYFAWLQWPSDLAIDRSSVYALSLGVNYVEDPTPAGFTFRALLPFQAATTHIRSGGNWSTETFRQELAHDILAVARGIRLTICWLGVEMEHVATA